MEKTKTVVRKRQDAVERVINEARDVIGEIKASGKTGHFVIGIAIDVNCGGVVRAGIKRDFFVDV